VKFIVEAFINFLITIIVDLFRACVLFLATFGFLGVSIMSAAFWVSYYLKKTRRCKKLKKYIKILGVATLLAVGVLFVTVTTKCPWLWIYGCPVKQSFP